MYHAMRGDSIRLAATALFLVSTGCRGDAAQANAIPREETSITPGESFPRALYKLQVDCPGVDERLFARPLMALDDFQQEWFSSHLAAAGERPLVALETGLGSDSFLMRFIWLPTFDNPVVVRLGGSTGDERRLVAVRLSGAGGYDPGKVAARLDRRLSDEEWARIDSLLTRTELLEQQPGECEFGLDGSEWIVESIDDDGYHFLKRWSPQDGAVHEFGSLLLELTGWQFDDIY